MSDSAENEQWYWDLGRGTAVRASERGPFTEMMGPYASKAEAERWQERVEERNTTWEDQDDEWEGKDDRPADAAGPVSGAKEAVLDDIDADHTGPGYTS